MVASTVLLDAQGGMQGGLAVFRSVARCYSECSPLSFRALPAVIPSATRNLPPSRQRKGVRGMPR